MPPISIVSKADLALTELMKRDFDAWEVVETKLDAFEMSFEAAESVSVEFPVPSVWADRGFSTVWMTTIVCRHDVYALIWIRAWKDGQEIIRVMYVGKEQLT